MLYFKQLLYFLAFMMSGCWGFGEVKCKPGEWRAMDLTQPKAGEVCSPCLPGHSCDGKTMVACELGKRALGSGHSECCSVDTICLSGAIGKGCLCKPFKGPLTQGPYGDYEPAEQNCGCPLPKNAFGGQRSVFVQTVGCQCVLGKKCAGQFWERGDGGYRCFAV